MIIPEGSKIIINNLSFSAKEKGIIASEDIEMIDNCIMLFNGYLCCTSANCVKKINDETYQINIWEQGGFCIKNGRLYKDVSDAD